MGRNKRLRRAILSLEKQIGKHREKIEQYQGSKKVLLDYWQGEIASMQRVKSEKEAMLKRKLRRKEERGEGSGIA